MFAKSFPGGPIRAGRSTLGHIHKVFFSKDGEQLVHIPAVVCLSEFRFRDINLIHIVHACQPLWRVAVGSSLSRDSIHTSAAAQAGAAGESISLSGAGLVSSTAK